MSNKETSPVTKHYRVVFPFPSMRRRDLMRPWLVHPLLSLSGPVRVLRRQALMRQPGAATAGVTSRNVLWQLPSGCVLPRIPWSPRTMAHEFHCVV